MTAEKTTLPEAVKHVANLVWNSEIIILTYLDRNFYLFIPRVPRVPDQAGAQQP